MALGKVVAYLRAAKTLTDERYGHVKNMVTGAFVYQQGNVEEVRKTKTRLQLILLSCAVCGIEFCYAAETAFVSPTLLKLGVPVAYMSLTWCLSPLLGLVLGPLLGSISDRCSSSFGRRRPFIVLLSIGIVAGLLMVPNGKNLGVFLGDETTPTPPCHPSLENNSSIGFEIQPELFNRSLRSPTFSAGLDNLIYSPGIKSGKKKPRKTGNYSTTTSSTGGSTIPFQSCVAELSRPFGILFTIIGVVLLDSCCDACQSPCRAFLLDVSLPEDHASGLGTFTVMAGLGGSVGYLLGGINWENTHFGEALGGHVKVVFMLVLIIYVICVTLTLASAKEIPLKKLESPSEDSESYFKKIFGFIKYKRFKDEDSDNDEESKMSSKLSKDFHMSNYGSKDTEKPEVANFTLDIYEDGSVDLEKPSNNSVCGHPHSELELPNSDPENIKATPQIVQQPTVQGLEMEDTVSLGTYLKSIVKMPRSLAILCLTNFFCWMSLVCYSLYFTDFVGQAVYGGNPNAPKNSYAHERYEEGVRMGAFGMSLYSISCSMYSMSIHKLIKTFGAKYVYVCSQLVYTIGAALMVVLRRPAAVVLLSFSPGIMYATLFTMPYIIIAHYHSTQTFSEATSSSLVVDKPDDKQIRGLGTDIALVSSMVFAAQFLLSSFVGSLVHAVGSPVVVMIAASGLSFCGAISANMITYLDL